MCELSECCTAIAVSDSQPKLLILFLPCVSQASTAVSQTTAGISLHAALAALPHLPLHATPALCSLRLSARPVLPVAAVRLAILCRVMLQTTLCAASADMAATCFLLAGWLASASASTSLSVLISALRFLLHCRRLETLLLIWSLGRCSGGQEGVVVVSWLLALVVSASIKTKLRPKKMDKQVCLASSVNYEVQV